MPWNAPCRQIWRWTLQLCAIQHATYVSLHSVTTLTVNGNAFLSAGSRFNLIANDSRHFRRHLLRWNSLVTLWASWRHMSCQLVTTLHHLERCGGMTTIFALSSIYRITQAVTTGDTRRKLRRPVNEGKWYEHQPHARHMQLANGDDANHLTCTKRHKTSHIYSSATTKLWVMFVRICPEHCPEDWTHLLRFVPCLLKRILNIYAPGRWR